ncbi:hypothetical protein ACWGS8_20725 [Mesorhizobium sp. 43Arga]
MDRSVGLARRLLAPIFAVAITFVAVAIVPRMKARFEAFLDRCSYLPSCAVTVRSMHSYGERILYRIFDRTRFAALRDKYPLWEVGLLLLVTLPIPIAIFIAVLLARIW